jgi:hypothetical protein
MLIFPTFTIRFLNTKICHLASVFCSLDLEPLTMHIRNEI